MNNEIERDWLSGPLIPDHRYHRVEVVATELRDFGRDVGIFFKDEQGQYWAPAMTRAEVQKLFDDLCRYGFARSDA